MSLIPALSYSFADFSFNSAHFKFNNQFQLLLLPSAFTPHGPLKFGVFSDLISIFLNFHHIQTLAAVHLLSSPVTHAAILFTALFFFFFLTFACLSFQALKCRIKCYKRY